MLKERIRNWRGIPDDGPIQITPSEMPSGQRRTTHFKMPPTWQDAKRKSDEKDAEFHREMEELIQTHREMDRKLKNITMPCLRLATKKDYIKWLEIAKDVGVAITNFYDYPFPSHDWFVAKRDVTICPAYGAGSINIIVLDPKIVVTIDGLGHNNVYYPDGSVRGGWVPMYSDIGGY